MRKSRFIIGLAFLATLALGSSGCVIDDGCFDNCCFDGCCGGGCNPQIFTIQQAIDLAFPGDTVFIQRGVYSPSTNGEFFPIFMRNDVSVIGEDPQNTILDAEGGRDELPLMPKPAVADLILDRLARALDDRDSAAQTG